MFYISIFNVTLLSFFRNPHNIHQLFLEVSILDSQLDLVLEFTRKCNKNRVSVKIFMNSLLSNEPLLTIT